jgi:hypothetical protein
MPAAEAVALDVDAPIGNATTQKQPGSSTNTWDAVSSSASGDHGKSTSRADGAESRELEPRTIVGWANVKRDGALSRSRNITGSTRHAAGEYEIAFVKASLRHCTFNATLSGFGFVSVQAGPLASSLKVETRNHYGVLSDAAFYLMAVC